LDIYYNKTSKITCPETSFYFQLELPHNGFSSKIAGQMNVYLSTWRFVGKRSGILDEAQVLNPNNKNS
jgi:hypothetical protein